MAPAAAAPARLPEQAPWLSLPPLLDLFASLAHTPVAQLVPLCAALHRPYATWQARLLGCQPFAAPLRRIAAHLVAADEARVAGHIEQLLEAWAPEIVDALPATWARQHDAPAPPHDSPAAATPRREADVTVVEAQRMLQRGEERALTMREARLVQSHLPLLARHMPPALYPSLALHSPSVAFKLLVSLVDDAADMLAVRRQRAELLATLPSLGVEAPCAAVPAFLARLLLPPAPPSLRRETKMQVIGPWLSCCVETLDRLKREGDEERAAKIVEVLCSFISSAILPGLAQQADELEARTDEALLVECRHFALHNSRLRRAGALLAQLMLVDGKS